MTRFPIDGTGRLASERDHPTGVLPSSAAYKSLPDWSGSFNMVSLLDSRFAVVGDGSTDDWAAINTVVEGLGTTSDPTGTTIRVPAFNSDGTSRIYRLSKPLHLNRNVILEGESGMPWYTGGVFKFDAGIHGIIIDSSYEPSAHAGFGNFAQVRNLGLASAGGTPRTVTDVVTTTTSTTLTSAAAAFTGADVGKALVEVPGTAHVLYPGTSIQSVTNATTVVLSEPAIDTATGVHVVIGGGCGLVMAGTAKLENIVVDGSRFAEWGGHGIYIKAEVPYSNANGWTLDTCWVTNCALDAFHTQSDDANAGVAISCNANNCGATGFRDDSFLGNAYFGCETANCTNAYQIATASAGANPNASTLFGCYREGASPNFFGENVTVIGGTNMAADAGDGMVISPNAGGSVGGGGEIKPSIAVRNANNAKEPYVVVGGQDVSIARVLRIGSEVDAHELGLFYAGAYGPAGNWCFAFDASGSRVALQLVGPLDSNGRNNGTVRFPNGFLLNDGAGIVGGFQTYGSAAPISGDWKQGDIVWNTAPAPAGNVGWVCVTTGTPGTWKTFGTIAA